MSATFSGVIRKPGAKFAPRPAPRRNSQRGATAAGTNDTPESSNASPAPATATQHDEANEAPSAVPVEPSSPHNGVRTSPTPPVSATDTSHSPHVLPAFPVTAIPDPVASYISQVTAPIEDTEQTQLAPTHATPNHENATNTSDLDLQPRSSTAPSRTKRKSAQSHQSQERSNADPTQTRSDTSNRPDKRRRQEPAQSGKSALSTQDASNAAEPPTRSIAIPAALHFSLTPHQSSLPAVDLFEIATRQAAQVSTLANEINDRTRASTPRPPTSGANAQQRLTQPADGTMPPGPGSPSTSRRKRAQEMDALAAAVIDGTGGAEGGRRRAATPEDAENHVIEPSEVTMGDLVVDKRLGKKSETEKKMQENWTEISKRRKEQLERTRELAQTKSRVRSAKDRGRNLPPDGAEDPPPVVPSIVPVQTIVNGQIVVQHESREIDPTAHLQQQVLDHHENVREIDKIYKHVNQSTLNPRSAGRHGKQWDDESTELFYKGIRMFGTDFLMIANLFPHMSRSQIKNKYNREERSNYPRVLEALSNKENIDLAEYAKMTDKQWEDPQKLEEELAAEEKRLHEEDEKRRAEEGFVNPNADVALPSREQGSAEPIPAEERVDTWLNETQASPEVASGPMESLTASVVQAAVQPKKKQPRKSREPGKRKEPKKSKRPLEGVEERLGTIDEVEH